MIIKTFDQGWGAEYPIKQLELEIQRIMLRYLSIGTNQTVVINSMWYTDILHQTVLDWLEKNTFTDLVLVSMIDPAIAQPRQFEHFGKPINCIGNYRGAHEIDFWSLVVDRFMPHYQTDLLSKTSLIKIPFMCLNRKPHEHRINLFDALENAGLLDKGIISLGGKKILDKDVHTKELTPDAGYASHGMPNDVSSLGLIENWQQHFLNVVTETVFDINQQNFVSEKIHKPLLGFRPFLVYAQDGGVQWLTRHGFEPYIDDFKDLTSMNLADPHNLVEFLILLSNQSVDWLQYKFVSLTKKLAYNRSQLTKHIDSQKQIIRDGVSCPT